MKNRRARTRALLACLLTFAAAAGGQNYRAAAEHASAHATVSSGATVARPPAGTLCAADERVIFSCALRGSAKLVSLCGSKALTRDVGYIQYRFGRPGRVELEFPRDRAGSQKQFSYDHVFRFQFDQTEIGFDNGGFGYTVFDHYDGERKPARREAGVRVRPAGENAEETAMLCAGRVAASYGDLTEILTGN